MRKFVVFLIVTLTVSFQAFAQESFETAAPIVHKTSKEISLASATSYSYTKTLIPADGTVKVYIQGTHTGGSQGGMTFYSYDKSRRNIHTEHFATGLQNGDSFRDTMVIYSRTADSLYFLFYEPGNRSFDLTVTYEVVDQSPNDQEPNGTRPLAVNFNPNQKPEGHIGYIKDGETDHYDYHKTLIPENGTVQVYFEAKHSGGSDGSLGFYVYDKAGRNIYSNSSLGSKAAKYGETIRDTLNIYSRNVDTLYMLVYQAGGRSFQYKFNYAVIEQSATDQEPNNTFTTANPIAMGQLREGQIGYVTNGVTDHYDYYKTMLPGDGTVKIYIEGQNTGGSQGSFGIYAYDKSRRNILSQSVIGKAVPVGQTTRDTLEIVSREADSIYLVIYNAGGRSINYSFSYEMIDQSINDEEPNNAKPLGTIINENQNVIGHIGYEADGKTDHYDYYKTLLPEDGTIEIIIEAVHTGGSTGSFGLYMEDISGRNIFSKSVLGKGVSRNGIVRDTLLLHSREADSIYIYVYQAGGRSFSYNFSYRMIDKSPTDEEPNNTYQQALNLPEKQSVAGHLGYVADGSTDHYDHYKTVLPVDGTVRIIVNGLHTGGSQGSFGLYAYDKNRRNILSESVLGQAVSIYGKVSDTAYIYSRADDTVYINVYNAGGRSFQYSMSYEMIDTSLNDQANESYVTATEMYSDQTINGHIGYIDDGQTDHYDYYKTLLPVDGTVTIYIEGLHTGGSNGSFGFYAYDKQRRQISGNSTLGTGTISMGMTLKDTIRIDSRAADSIYLVVYSAGGRSFSYTLRYDMPGSLKGDPEPNNTFNEAVNFNLTDTLRGLIGYVQSGATDHNDYWKASVPDKSTLKVYIEGEHTGGSNGTFAIYAYDRNRRLLTSKTTLGNRQFSNGQTLLDTITVACNPTDSVYILIYQAGGRSFSYNVRFEHIDNKPNARFSYTRTANDFGFVNESKNTNSFIWNFANGTTSSVSMPTVNFKPGVYDVRLIANNSTCNFKDTMVKRITITGIEYFTPTKGGKGGDLNMQIFGGGLDTSARITLKKGGISIPSEEKYDNGVGSMLGMVFDLHFAEAGKYDLEVAFKNGDVIKYDTAFTIDAMIYPDTYSEIVGPSVWRTGRAANFNLVVGNNGNTVARGVIVVLVWPKSANLEFYGKQYSPDPKEFMVAEMEEYNETIKSPYSLVKWIYDSINTVTPIDTFKTEAYDGYVRFLYVPVIAPNSTYELPFKITADASAKHRLITYTVKPNQYGSCETYNIASAFTGPAAVELMINTLDWGVDELKVPKATKIPAQVAVKTLKVTQKHIDVSSNVLAHRMWASYYNWTSGGGGENHGLTDSEYYDYYKEGLAADEFAKNQLQDIAIDQGINLLQLPAGARKSKLNEQILDNNQALLNKANDYHKLAGKKTGRSKTWRMKKKEAAREWQKQFESGQVTIADLTELENLESIAEWAGRTKNAKGELEALLKYIEENCPEHKEALDKLKEELNKEKDINKEKEKETETRTSYDPNAIYGPSGFNQPGYVNTFDRHPFVIMFENVDTAKADAQIVKITDTIDKSKFDLSTFELGNITIGGKWYKLPKGRKEIMMEIDLTAERNMHVRLNASLDTATGIATWLLTSIDPRTGDIPDFDGFLPPNKDYPSGEGSVTFSIYPHKNLAHGTRLESKASIIFDFNEPILTNTWLNTIDAKKPTGSIQAEILEDSNIVINYNATDTESGVNYYNLYISEDNKEFVSIGGGNSTSQILPAESGKTYYFYVESEDRVGNVEEKSAVGEATVKVPEFEQAIAPVSTLIVYPIPTNGRLSMEFDVPVEQRISATVFSPSGVLVAEVYNAQVSGTVRTSTNLSHLANGIYFVRVRGDKGLNLYKKIIIMK